MDFFTFPLDKKSSRSQIQISEFQKNRKTIPAWVFPSEFVRRLCPDYRDGGIRLLHALLGIWFLVSGQRNYFPIFTPGSFYFACRGFDCGKIAEVGLDAPA
jgi:hypothetical protein